MQKKRIAVFCGSQPGNRKEYSAAAAELGTLIAAEGRTLVFGGCMTGLMRDVSSAARFGGAHVIAARIQGMSDPFDPTDEEILLPDLQSRKLTMISSSDACIALPGGIGTLDELTDVFTMRVMGLTHIPLGLLNLHGYFDPLLALLLSMQEEGFLPATWHNQLIIRQTPSELLNALDEC